MTMQMELPLETSGESREGERSEQVPTAETGEGGPGTSTLMEEVVSTANIERAAARVKKNKGAPGIDGMKVEELDGWLREQWAGVRERLLAGTYEPTPVQRVMIPKRGGGERMLGIPTVSDRLIQQAILQVLQPRIDPTFSEYSYGFRPRRSAHQAVEQMRGYVAEGREWVVDIDLEKFFDRVNHDVLMGRMAKRVDDSRVLRTIRRYLTAGVMADGVKVTMGSGTPQGGPLSPLLANVYLDEVDKELEARGHAFVRYADDLRVLVKSERAGQRVMSWLIRRFEKLRLRVNREKSTVAKVYERPFLGFGLEGEGEGAPKITVSGKAMDTMRERVRKITRRVRGRSLERVTNELRLYLRGWKEYFRLSEDPKPLMSADGWIRRRMRSLILYQCRTPWRAYDVMRSFGATDKQAREIAANLRHWWRNSKGNVHRVLTNSRLKGLGVPSLAP